MADVSITAANVLAGSNTTSDVVAGETVTAGQVVYQKLSTDSRYYKAQADGTAEEATVAGFALNGAAAGQPLRIQTAGPITIGGTVAVGTPYVVSATAGAICPFADLVSTNKVSYVGNGQTAAILNILRNLTGVVIP